MSRLSAPTNAPAPPPAGAGAPGVFTERREGALRPDRELHQISGPAGRKSDAVREVGVEVERDPIPAGG
jgi:hypothetical protein